MDDGETAVQSLPLPVSPPLPAAGPDPIEQLIERWWADQFPGSVLAHHTEVWNYVWAAKELLKQLLAEAASAAAKGSN